MSKKYPLLLTAILFSLTAFCQQNFADKIYYNAIVYTCDPTNTWVKAIAIKEDKIIYAGDNYSQYKNTSTTLIDLHQQLVLPGFIDSHVHFLSSGANLAGVDLRYTKTKEVFIQLLKKYAASLPPSRWITGGNWDHEQWGGDLPTKEMIDSITGDHPVAISRLDGHMILANSLALKMAGITNTSVSPDGGTIVKDAAGNPTGILKDNAQDIVFDIIPQPSEQQLTENFLRAQQHALSLGVTQVDDMGSYGGYPEIETYRRAEKNGTLKMRIYSFVPLATWQKLHEYVQVNGKGDDWVKWGGLKGFADGSLGSTTAWLYKPYLDQPGSSGLMVTDTAVMRQRILNADSVHLQVAIHAIGDRANDFILSCFEEAEKRDGNKDQRFRIEHAQHLSQDALTKFAALQVIPSMQPYHAIDDGRWAYKRLDQDRLSRTYAFRTLLNNKSMLAFGTDWDVAPLNPLLSIYAAVTRRTLDDKNPNGWFPQEKISVAEAVQCYTANSAYAAFQENKTGKLKAGMLADFIVLDKNIFKINPVEIKDAKVLRTIVGGKEMFTK
ncbi:MAG TPA: amidohydrolase [Parafilimonas sp.]|nr:amidohydrolase [Parafilimonas sp.]